MDMEELGKVFISDIEISPIIKTEESRILFPIKLILYQFNVNFNSAMMEFNSLNLKVKSLYHKIDDVEYLCFGKYDFLLFMTALSFKFEELVDLRTKILRTSESEMIVYNPIEKTIEKELSKLFEDETDMENASHYTVGDVHKMLPKAIREACSTTAVGKCLRRKGYVRKAIRSIKFDGPRYGYMLSKKGAQS